MAQLLLARHRYSCDIVLTHALITGPFSSNYMLSIFYTGFSFPYKGEKPQFTLFMDSLLKDGPVKIPWDWA